jgi:hypothetical protein
LLIGPLTDEEDLPSTTAKELPSKIDNESISAPQVTPNRIEKTKKPNIKNLFVSSFNLFILITRTEFLNLVDLIRELMSNNFTLASQEEKLCVQYNSFQVLNEHFLLKSTDVLILQRHNNRMHHRRRILFKNFKISTVTYAYHHFVVVENCNICEDFPNKLYL